MIIQIRGTSGSGKTHLMKRVMAVFNFEPVTVEAAMTAGFDHPDLKLTRKQPLMYVDEARKIIVLGHYEAACGGCDTLAPQDLVFSLIRWGNSLGYHVLWEGLLLSGDFQHTFKLHQDGLPITIIELDVPLEVCLDSIQSRRAAKGGTPKPLGPGPTQKWHGCKRVCERFRLNGVRVLTGDRDASFLNIIEELP